MTRHFRFSLLPLAGILFAALPASATTLSVNDSATGATFTTSGAGNNIGSFNISLNSILSLPTLTNTTLTDVALEYTAGSSVITVTETQNGIYTSINAGTALFTFNISGPLVLNSSGSALVTGSATSTGIKVLSTSASTQFLTDLGTSSVPNAAVFAANIVDNSLFVQGNNSGTTFTPNSYGFSVSTPEPVSCFLLGSGLLMVGLLRKKFIRS